jgi:HK97 family phage prohead protease
MLRQEFPGSIRAVSNGGFEFIAASSVLARDGHVVVVSGLDTKNYLRGNPIILRDHLPSQPVGRCTGLSLDLSKQPNELRGSAEWAPEGVSAVADETRNLARAGVLNAISIGFDIKDSEPLKPSGGRGLRIKKSELLELSIVACGADPLAVITQRAYRSNAMNKHLLRLEELVDTAARVHHDLGRAIDRGDDLAVDRHHLRLGRCLRDAQKCIRNIHQQAALDDLQANQLAQNSDGMGPGTSGGGRSAGFEYRQRQRRLLELSPGAQPSSAAERAAEVAALLPRAPMYGGGSVVHWAGAMRQYLQDDALYRATRVSRGHPLRRTERQIELARLARGA